MSIDREIPVPPPTTQDDGSTVPARAPRRTRHGKRPADPSLIWRRAPRASDDPIRMAGLLPPIPSLMLIVADGGTVVAASRHLRDLLARPLLGADLDTVVEMPGGIVWLEGEPSDTLVVEGARLVLGHGTKKRVTLHGGWREFEGERLFFALFELQPEVDGAAARPSSSADAVRSAAL